MIAHGAIGHRLSATKVYENNVPSLDWQGLKNFKDCGEFVNFFFLYKQLNSTKSTGWIYKQIHFSKRKKKTLQDLYIQILCLWSVLCMSSTILTVLWMFLSCCFFVYFCMLHVCNWKPVRNVVKIMKMWKHDESVEQFWLCLIVCLK